VPPLRARWLGRVPYHEALAVQRALHQHGREQHLLLLEHPHVFTLGVRGDPANILVDPASVGATVVRTDRGGDVTYHGPGQLVGYPVLAPPGVRGSGLTDTVAYVRSVEQVLIDALADLGLPGAGRLPDYPGVWVEPDGPNPRKIAAIGVKLTRGRSLHGFALNVTTDLEWFRRIIPCGIADKPVTSLAAEGLAVTTRQVVDAVVARAAVAWGGGEVDRADVAWKEAPDDLSPFSRGAGPGRVVRPHEHGPAPVPPAPPAVQPVRLRSRLEAAGVSGGLAVGARKPDWLRAKAKMGNEFTDLRKLLRELRLVTVCEDAGCPNIFECWHDGTATFMINGDRCTRACGFCLVDTSKPLELDHDEPERVAEAVERLGLRHAVITAVARDDLADGGAAAFAATIRAVRDRVPACAVEVLIPDCRGDADALGVILAVRPDVLNHNLETVARLQRAVRPSAGYARSLGVLAMAKAAGLTTKSGIIVGMGETDPEVVGVLADLAGIGCDIVTIGQYLRPTTNHIPVARWVEPERFAWFASEGERLGIGHVEASPLTRSSYHARQAAEALPGTAAVAPLAAPSGSFS
jgi:lipoyl synthase